MTVVYLTAQPAASTFVHVARTIDGQAVKRTVIVGMSAHIVQRLPTDSIGIFTLTLTNLIVGSAIRIEIAGSGTLVEYRVAASSTEVFTVPAYSVGSSNNDLRIKVRKASAAPRYKPYETQATALVGAQSVFIAQISDE